MVVEYWYKAEIQVASTMAVIKREVEADIRNQKRLCGFRGGKICGSFEWDRLTWSDLQHVLELHSKEVVGVSGEVVVGEPGDVARAQGKAQRVVDNRAKE